MFVESLHWNRLLAIGADDRLESTLPSMISDVFSVDVCRAMLTDLFCVLLLHVFLEVVDIDHFVTLLALSNVPSAVGEVDVDLAFRKRLFTV